MTLSEGILNYLISLGTFYPYISSAIEHFYDCSSQSYKRARKLCASVISENCYKNHEHLGPVHMGRSYLGYRENISTSLQARSRLVMK